MKKFNVGKTYKRFSSIGKLLYTLKVQNRIDLKNGTSVIDYTIIKHYSTPNNNKDIVNEPVHSTSVLWCSDTSEVLFDSTYHVIIHPVEQDSTSHIKYRQYLYKVCTNKDYFTTELHNIKKYKKSNDIKGILLNLVLVTCEGIVKYNFSELTNRDALAIIVRGVRGIVEDIMVTDNTLTSNDLLDKGSLNNIPMMHSSLLFIDISIMYSRYNTKFDPDLNKIIEKVLHEYRDH